MTQYKQAIILRTDLEMSKGKMIAQGCHASLKAYKKANKEHRNSWENKGSKKIVLKTNKKQMMQKKQQADRNNLPNSLITDAGHTELKPGTKTALAIGPHKENQIDKVTSDLNLLN